MKVGFSGYQIQKVKKLSLRCQNLLMVIGLVISFSGGSWDITYHILTKPESFFSYPHSLVYAGIMLVIITFFFNINHNLKEIDIIRKNYFLILTGVVLILVAGPIDFLWHLRFGLDGLLSPPHLTLLSGWLLVAIGNLKITDHRLRNKDTKDTVDVFNTYSNKKISMKKNIMNYLVSRTKQVKSKYDIIILVQLFLNLFILLMIVSGFLYFFSLPFSQTSNYNFNPQSTVGLLIYGIGFAFLFTTFFRYVYTRYHLFPELIPFTGISYILITLFTQITSNPHLVTLTNFYLLNMIPFIIFYLIGIKELLQECQNDKAINLISNLPAVGFFNSMRKNPNWRSNLFLMCVFPVLTYTLCFPLNVYIYNEEFYGYLIYQNIVWSVYQQIFADFFIIILPLSLFGGLFGFKISGKISAMNPKSLNVRKANK